MVTEHDLLNLDQAAALLGVSKSTVYRLLDQGKVKGMKAGKQWRFRQYELLGYIERGPAALALAQLPISLLDTEVTFFTDALAAMQAPLPEDRVDLSSEEGKLRTLVMQMAQLVIARGASDLHLEPVREGEKDLLLLRIRVSGLLQEIRRLPIGLLEPLMRQWKVMSGLDVNERRRPQDGNLQVSKTARFRISIVPTIYGEALALRTIPMHIPQLELLFREPYLSRFRGWAARTHGLILFTGPTSSGKSTSTVSCLYDRITPTLKAVSVEEPVEYVIPGVMQLDVEGFSMVEGLRAMLRHDPDVILVGELRDAEAARQTAYLAETGHLVFTVMHTHNVAQALYQLRAWGIDPALLCRNLIGLTVQSLLRKLCPECRKPTEFTAEQLAGMCVDALMGGYEVPTDVVFYSPCGCEACQGTGYKGRDVIEEIFEFTPVTTDAYLRNIPEKEFQTLAVAQGMRTRFAEGVRMAVEGITSLEEVYRVTR